MEMEGRGRSRKTNRICCGGSTGETRNNQRDARHTQCAEQNATKERHKETSEEKEKSAKPVAAVGDVLKRQFQSWASGRLIVAGEATWTTLRGEDVRCGFIKIVVREPAAGGDSIAVWPLDEVRIRRIQVDQRLGASSDTGADGKRCVSSGLRVGRPCAEYYTRRQRAPRQTRAAHDRHVSSSAKRSRRSAVFKRRQDIRERILSCWMCQQLTDERTRTWPSGQPDLFLGWLPMTPWA